MTAMTMWKIEEKYPQEKETERVLDHLSALYKMGRLKGVDYVKQLSAPESSGEGVAPTSLLSLVGKAMPGQPLSRIVQMVVAVLREELERISTDLELKQKQYDAWETWGISECTLAEWEATLNDLKNQMVTLETCLNEWEGVTSVR